MPKLNFLTYNLENYLLFLELQKFHFPSCCFIILFYPSGCPRNSTRIIHFQKTFFLLLFAWQVPPIILENK